MNFGNSVWPNDVVGIPHELQRDSPLRLVCFLLSPFVPPEQFDLVHRAVVVACENCQRSAGIEIECRRADTLHEAKAIHDDIWRHIASADVLVVDVTGLNPNVMIELGVAAAMRRPTQVILIKSEEDSSRLPFNAFAQRCLSYRRSIAGDWPFIKGLTEAMIQAITPAPYRPWGATPAEATGLNIDFAHGDRPDIVLSPAPLHRRMVGDCLEFGSYYVFKNSWVLLTAADYQNVRVRLLCRFASVVKEAKEAFVAVFLRSQHFHANWGHMFLLGAQGRVWRTEPQDDLGNYRDVNIGEITSFQHESSEFVEMKAEFTPNRLQLSVGPVDSTIPVAEMPFVYGAGKVRIATSYCRVQVRQVTVEPL
jgi:hypothetical protein